METKVNGTRSQLLQQFWSCIDWQSYLTQACHNFELLGVSLQHLPSWQCTMALALPAAQCLRMLKANSTDRILSVQFILPLSPQSQLEQKSNKSKQWLSPGYSLFYLFYLDSSFVFCILVGRCLSFRKRGVLWSSRPWAKPHLVELFATVHHVKIYLG